MLECGKPWKLGEDAGNVSVNHFQYCSDIFMCTQNTVMQNFYCQTIIDGRQLAMCAYHLCSVPVRGETKEVLQLFSKYGSRARMSIRIPQEKYTKAREQIFQFLAVMLDILIKCVYKAMIQHLLCFP